ncbi:iron-siderophore ABC transporter substrate-binding protein [Utexia brackfieldae]|uniref:iron-siderophore ABC transporter substrate-binding protein n=1 Tax=Utexia brackfieldae TaxID=3074108 RepID=UPI00370D62D3
MKIAVYLATMAKWSILLLCLALNVTAFAQVAKPAQKIVTTDWTIAETLLAIDAPLVGLGDKKQYDIWVNTPVAGDAVIDLGSRAQPNQEALINLKPDHLINATWLQNILPSSMSTLGIQRSAVDFYTDKGLDWSHLVATTLALGKLVDREHNAEQLISDSEQQLAHDRMLLTPYQDRSYAVVQFIDSRHLRIYGENSLYGLVLTQLHLTNAWQKPTNAWGFNQITLLELAQLPANTVLIIVKPYPANVAEKLQQNALWRALPFHQAKQYRLLPAVWSFGALPSIKRFSQLLTESITDTHLATW